MDQSKMMEEDLAFQKARLDRMKELNSLAVIIENQTAIIADIENNANQIEIAAETEL